MVGAFLSALATRSASSSTSAAEAISAQRAWIVGVTSAQNRDRRAVGQVEQVGRGRLEQRAPRRAAARPARGTGRSRPRRSCRVEVDLAERALLLDLACGGDVAVPHVPADPPGPGQSHAGVTGAGRGRRPSAEDRDGGHAVAQTGHQVGQQDVASQPVPQFGRAGRRRGGRCRSSTCSRSTQFARAAFFSISAS